MKAERRVNINDDDLLFDDEAGVYVVVIGESHTKDHMSAYGYDKDTAPWLTKMRDNGRAVIMERAYSCHTHTTPVLSYALTEKNQYDSRTLADCAAFTDMAKGRATARFGSVIKRVAEFTKTRSPLSPTLQTNNLLSGNKSI